MRSTRTLALRRETLADLTPAELNAVAGGSHGTCPYTHRPTFDERCPTMPPDECLSLDGCIQTAH